MRRTGQPAQAFNADEQTSEGMVYGVAGKGGGIETKSFPEDMSHILV
jgi:hypothetical protein